MINKYPDIRDDFSGTALAKAQPWKRGASAPRKREKRIRALAPVVVVGRTGLTGMPSSAGPRKKSGDDLEKQTYRGLPANANPAPNTTIAMLAAIGIFRSCSVVTPT